MAKILPLFTWRSAIADSGLPPATRHVALALSLYMNERGGSGHPGPTRLAHDTGLHLSTVKAKLTELERTGWLRCIERGGFKGARKCANVYEARVPVASDDPSSPTTRRPGHPVPQTTRRPDRAHPSSSAQPPVVLDDPISPENSPENSPIAPATRTRARDPIFDALCSVTNTAPHMLTKSGRGAMNNAAKQLRDLGATPDEIRRNHAELQRRYPTARLTESALVKHWATLGGGRSAAEADQHDIETSRALFAQALEGDPTG